MVGITRFTSMSTEAILRHAQNSTQQPPHSLQRADPVNPTRQDPSTGPSQDPKSRTSLTGQKIFAADRCKITPCSRSALEERSISTPAPSITLLPRGRIFPRGVRMQPFGFASSSANGRYMEPVGDPSEWRGSESGCHDPCWSVNLHDL